MKVSETRPGTGPSHGRRVAAARSAASGFAAHVQAPQTEGPSDVPAPRPLAALGTVLAAQAAQDGAEERRRALARGRSLLDELDLIRIGLLDGALPVATIRRLSGLLQANRSSVADAQLNAVLDEIELRAAVELAKRQQDATERDDYGPAGTCHS
jgi:Class II flagellar assembly regulator